MMKKAGFRKADFKKAIALGLSIAMVGLIVASPALAVEETLANEALMDEVLVQAAAEADALAQWDEIALLEDAEPETMDDEYGIATIATYDTTYAVEGGYLYFDSSTGTIANADTSITSVEIPSSIDGVAVTSIGEDAFYKCTSLTSVTLPEGVTSIGDSAFRYCSKLTDVYYAGSESDWSAISIDGSNTDLTSATIHYNYIVEDTATAILSGETEVCYIISIDDTQVHLNVAGGGEEYWDIAAGADTSSWAGLVGQYALVAKPETDGDSADTVIFPEAYAMQALDISANSRYYFERHFIWIYDTIPSNL